MSDILFFDDRYHHVVIVDPVAKRLADKFLPPDGAPITAAELAAAIRRLEAAVREEKRLEERRKN